MAELGKYAEEEHQQILNQVLKIQLNEIWLVGKEFFSAAKKLNAINNNLKFFNDVESLKNYFTEQKMSGYYFLLKGSRVNKLEKMIA